MGRDSDASGGSANGGNGEGNGNEGRGGGNGGGSGDGGRGVGNRTASRGGMAAENARGGLGSMGGMGRRGGFGGMGIGNPTSHGAVANPRGYEKSVDVQAQRDNLNNVGKGVRGIGAVIGAPVSLAGHVMSAVAKHGRVEGELSDMERAARANDMGGTNRDGDNSNLKALTANLDMANPINKALVDSISPAKPTMTADQLKSQSEAKGGVSANDVFARRTTGTRA